MEQQEALPRKRVRIEVGTSTKGVHTFSATVELVTDTWAHDPEFQMEVSENALLESDWLVAELDKRYPAPGVD